MAYAWQGSHALRPCEVALLCLAFAIRRVHRVVGANVFEMRDPGDCVVADSAQFSDTLLLHLGNAYEGVFDSDEDV